MHVNDMIPNSMKLHEENQQLRHMIDSLKEDLRDQLAMSILSGLCANPSVIAFRGDVGWAPVNCSRKQLTEYAYAMAKEALDAREEVQ